jgi:hypothetical protein
MSAVEVVELCPLRAVALLWRPQEDARVLTVVCKATFPLQKGVVPLADAQDDVNDRDLHAENNPKLGLYSASDLAPFKLRADATVVGKAYSPPGELARALVARLKVGTVDKRVAVHAERYMRADGRVRDNKFFSKMSIGYERAPGGPDSDNPVGMSFTEDEEGRTMLPNLQLPGEAVRLDRPLSPVGLGPIPASWPSRRRRLAEHADWVANWKSQAVPRGFDWSFFNVAPPDQQLEEIPADANIRLEHLHPEEPKLDLRLPGIEPRIYVERPAGAQRVAMNADTLWIDTNRLRITLCWRGTVALESPEEQVRVFVAMSEIGQSLSWEQVWNLAETKRLHDEAVFDDQPTVIQKSRRPAGTVPVALASAGDHSPAWLPTPSSPGMAGPMSSPGVPSSRPDEISQPVVVELHLDHGELQMLRDLSEALGYDAVEALRHALREAHRHRFGR